MELCVLFSEINERGVLRENDYVRQKCELKIEYTYCVLQSGRDSAGSDIWTDSRGVEQWLIWKVGRVTVEQGYKKDKSLQTGK